MGCPICSIHQRSPSILKIFKSTTIAGGHVTADIRRKSGNLGCGRPGIRRCSELVFKHQVKRLIVKAANFRSTMASAGFSTTRVFTRAVDSAAHAKHRLAKSGWPRRVCALGMNWPQRPLVLLVRSALPGACDRQKTRCPIFSAGQFRVAGHLEPRS